jgi:hypothetical protein
VKASEGSSAAFARFSLPQSEMSIYLDCHDNVNAKAVGSGLTLLESFQQQSPNTAYQAERTPAIRLQAEQLWW